MDEYLLFTKRINIDLCLENPLSYIFANKPSLLPHVQQNVNKFPTTLSFDEAARRLVSYNKATKEKVSAVWD